MKKSIFALLCMLFALFAAPMVYADDAPDEAIVAQDEPLPPMVDPAIANNDTPEQ